ncbi:MAG: HlyD family efflux transporter periplasmic adaptor subunit [Proteobacteria bacterium]|nr:HlyD family efflux transporter periplasmic adaptor subunit [Pseudomonadota bacterium]
MGIQKEKYKVYGVTPRPAALDKVDPKRNYRLFFGALAFTFIFFVSCMVLLPWQQTATGYGRVIAYAPNDRQQEINAPVDGRIQKWHVFEGTKVKAGDAIVDLTDNDPEILDRLRLERDALAKRASAAELAVQTAKLNLERQQILFEKGLSAKRAVEQANLDFTRYLVDEANAAAELARIDVRLARQMTQSVTAPVDGTILRVVAGQGAQIVKAGQMLAIIVPSTESRAVEIFLNGNDVPLIREGAHVRIQFEGWPALQFSGWPGAAIGTFGGKIALIDASDNGTGKFRVLVSPVPDEPWPDTKYLLQGVRAQGWVLLNQVRLGFEIWRRFNGFPPSLPGLEKGTAKTEKTSK